MHTFSVRRMTRPALALKFALSALSAAAPCEPALAAGAFMVVAQSGKPSGQGMLNSIDARNRKLNITHGPIAALQWPAMTMDFGVAPGVDFGALKPGEKIDFTLTRGVDGMFVIDAIKPVE